ncbi:MAG: hypothetical protein IJU03_09260 [Thermoguttaceae bacterium]|nr:hypothetical protein [Thermoguttaceae bacterium]
MTRLSCVSVVLFALLTLSAQLGFSAEPKENLTELVSQTFTAPINFESVDELVNTLSLAQDVDAAEKALELALTLDELPSARAETIAACYYNLRLLDAVQEGIDSALDAYAERVLDDMRRSDVCANVSFQACRNLSFYDSERAKKLYLELVAELAASDRKERRDAIKRLREPIFTVSAPSDITFDVSTFPTRDVSVRDAARLLAELNASQRAYLQARSLGRVSNSLDLGGSTAYTKGYPETREFYNEILLNSELSPYSSLVDVRKREMQPTINYDPNIPEDILRSIERLRNGAKRTLPDHVYYDSYRRYFDVVELQAAREGTDEAYERLIDQYVAAIESSPEFTTEIVVEFAYNLKRVDERWYDRLIKTLRASENSEVNDVADRIEGFWRPRIPSGYPAALEGVCEDGEEITIEDYRGKTVLLCFSSGVPIKLYEKYHASGFEIVLYQDDYSRQGVPARKAPGRFKCVSRPRTRENPKLGGRAFTDLAYYYGVGPYPMVRVVLIGPDGQVVASGVNSSEVEDALKKIYPDVK